MTIRYLPELTSCILIIRKVAGHACVGLLVYDDLFGTYLDVGIRFHFGMSFDS
jgi:hypothetical protein